ncbi:hypothetical protein ACFVWY_18205 [Streptomyces sp. NPDC058195]|uniref:hypothetical protein n=1 Tax=Streptomyces sp. NPDC058195 TaxID=3346375 RepID=UPI0036E570D6
MLSGTEGGRTSPELDADVEIAAALWRITGEPGEAVPVLARVLAKAGPQWMRRTLGRAARAAAGIGAPARPLVPALEGLLAGRAPVPAVLLALHAIAPDCLDAPRAAGLLLDAVERDDDTGTALEALAALGPAVVGEDGRRRLTALAERDLRVCTSGLQGGLVPGDERLRERIRETVRRLSTDRPAYA